MSTTGTLCRQIRSGPKRQQGLTVSELQALRVGFVPGGDALLMRLAAVHLGGQRGHQHQGILPLLDRHPLDAGVDRLQLGFEPHGAVA